MPEVALEPEVLVSLDSFRRALKRADAGLRRPLPWIELDDPWAIFVSEVMLQQTSTRRVVEPWRRFMTSYPTPETCAKAPLSDVLRQWSGLGFPRRAKSLHDAATLITEMFEGEVPRDPHDLLRLPGVGPYTANAVASFAYGRRVAVLDTNVGRVLARALANRPLRPREAQALATALLPRSRVAAFNQALLDLGAQFCTSTPRCTQCPVAKQCRWHRDGGDDPAPRSAGVSRPQRAFVGSDRQVRGRILKSLSDGALRTSSLLAGLNDVDVTRIAKLVDDLVDDGLVERRADTLALSGDHGTRQ